MAMTVVSAADMHQKIQDRINSGEWWVIPITDAEGFALVEEIASRFYQGDNSKLIEAVVIPSPIPRVSYIFLIMAAKQCMSPAQVGEFVCRDHLGAGSRALIIYATGNSISFALAV